MTNSLIGYDIKKKLSAINWQLLLFLILFLNVKLAVKTVTIILIFILQFNLKPGFKIKNSRLPLFYPAVLIITFINLIIYEEILIPNYFLVFLAGTAFWAICILASHQIKLFVERNDSAQLNNTLRTFFLINALVAIVNLASIILETGELNPYLYQGGFQKYFINTGDYIKGITLDTSTTNAVICAFGVIYFLVKKHAGMLLLCMLVLLLTVSNFVNILISLTLLFALLWKTNADQKSMIAVCLLSLVCFMSKVSPQNNKYTLETFTRLLNKPSGRITLAQQNDLEVTSLPDSSLTRDQQKQKFAVLYLDSISHPVVISSTVTVVADSTKVIEKPVVPVANIHTLPFQSRSDTTAEQRRLIDFISVHNRELHLSGTGGGGDTLPGKLLAVTQTLKFLKNHPAKIMTGDGIGNFSSKLAFRSTGLGVAGNYPARFAWISPDFLSNHLDVYLDFFSKRPNKHSLTNSPNSVFNQLAGEYGILGLLAFIMLYLGFFARHYRQLTYGIPLLLFMSGVFFIDYWFEQLSVMILFEFMMFLDIKETSTSKLTQHAKS